MIKLTGTQHGDSANLLFGFYQQKAAELEDSGQHFMSAIALAFAVEAAILAYLLVEFGDENGGELKIPADVNFSDLITAAKEIDVLSAPTDVPSCVRDDGRVPKYLAKDIVDQIRKFRNLIHPAASLKRNFDPHSFTSEQLREFKEMYEAVTHSLMYYI